MFEFETPLNGDMHRFEVRVVPLGQDEVLSMARDVTELWQTRRDLEIANTRLEFAAHAARLAWWEMDAATGQVYFDARKVIMTGYDPQAYKNATYQDFIALAHPEDRAPMTKALYDLLEGRKPIYAADYRMGTADQNWLWFHDRGELITLPNGQQVVRGYVIDVTEHKQAQQREVELALERERVSLLTNFIQNAAHEFRTPLTIIGTSAFVMARMAEPEERLHKLAIIQAQVQRIVRLTEMLLVMTRLESSSPATRTAVDLGEIFEELCHKMKMQHAHQPQPLLRCEREPNLPLVLGDPDELAEALEQLLDNACRFTPPDGTVTFAAGAATDHVWLTVQDMGPGILPENLPHIFETFWRQDEAHRTPGFGLGLPIAQRIFTSHGGTINVTSQVNAGCTFRVTLPIYQPYAASG